MGWGGVGWGLCLLFVFQGLVRLFEETSFVFDLEFQYPFAFYECEDFGGKALFIVSCKHRTSELVGRTDTVRGSGRRIRC